MYIACPALECTTYETGDTSSQQYKAIRKKKIARFFALVFVLVLMKILPLTSQICRPHRVEATSSGGHIEWRPHQVQVWNMVATIFQTCSGGLNCVRFRKVPQFERLGNTVTQFCLAGRLSTGNQQETNSCTLMVD